MTVIRYPAIEPRGPVAGVLLQWELRSITGVSRSGQSNIVQSVARPGAAWAATLRYEDLFDEDRDRMKAFITACRGQENRFYVRDWAYQQRGSFPNAQLVTSPEMNSLTGWNNNSSNFQLTVTEDMIRHRALNRITGASFDSGSLTVTAGVPYVARVLSYKDSAVGRQRSVRVSDTDSDLAAVYVNSNDFRDSSRVSYPFVPSGSSAWLRLVMSGTAGSYLHESFLYDHASVSRCMLIDVPENLLVHSEDFSHAFWVKTRSSVSVNAAQFGNEAVADELIEDGTASSTHYVQQEVTISSDREMATAALFVKRGSGTRNVRLEMVGGTTTHFGYANFDLGTPAVGSLVTGGDFTQMRATITAVPAADDTGWYKITLSGITDASTRIIWRLYLLDGTSGTYNGDGTSSVYVVGGDLKRSALAGRYSATTSTSIAGGNALNPGSSVFVKGLPTDTADLLLPGDFIEAITVPDDGSGVEKSQVCRVVAPLVSDAYGVGLLEIEPPLRYIPDISQRYGPGNGGLQHRIEPHIVTWRPEARMLLDENTVRWGEKPGGLTNLSLVAVEDLT